MNVFFFYIYNFSVAIVVVITIRGPVDKKTGMVMNLTELRDAMHTAILEPLDHKNLDKDLDYFKYKVNVNLLVNFCLDCFLLLIITCITAKHN